MSTHITKAAQHLADRRANRQPFAALPDPIAPRTVEEAYAVQDTLGSLLAAQFGPITGYKIALTSLVAQQQLGIHQPIGGFILERSIFRSPATVPVADYVHVGLELEIAVRLAQTLPASAAPFTRDTVARAVGEVMTAFEIVDDRNADYVSLSKIYLTAIADDIWNAGLVIGAPVTNWHSLDLAAVEGIMHINDTVVGAGHGSDVMGHPFESLAWLANNLAARGKSMQAGDLVTTGTFVRLQYVQPGDVLRGSVQGLGEITARIT
jgi:2-keto-4-pentenoate hydratase